MDTSEEEPLLVKKSQSTPEKEPKNFWVGKDGALGWTVALAIMLINFVTIGLGRMSGILYVDFMRNYHVNRKMASAPFSVQQSTRNLFGPLVGLLGHRFGIRSVTIAGGLIGAFSAAACAFAKDIIWITVFWGGFYGTGIAFTSTLSQVILDEYFEHNLSSASGLSFSGGSVGAMVFSFVLQPTIDDYGLENSYFIMGAVLLLVVPLALTLTSPPWPAVKQRERDNDEKIGSLSSSSQSITSLKKDGVFTNEKENRDRKGANSTQKVYSNNELNSEAESTIGNLDNNKLPDEYLDYFDQGNYSKVECTSGISTTDTTCSEDRTVQKNIDRGDKFTVTGESDLSISNLNLSPARGDSYKVALDKIIIPEEFKSVDSESASGDADSGSSYVDRQNNSALVHEGNEEIKITQENVNSPNPKRLSTIAESDSSFVSSENVPCSKDSCEDSAKVETVRGKVYLLVNKKIFASAESSSFGCNRKTSPETNDSVKVDVEESTNQVNTPGARLASASEDSANILVSHQDLPSTSNYGDKVVVEDNVNYQKKDNLCETCLKSADKGNDCLFASCQNLDINFLRENTNLVAQILNLRILLPHEKSSAQVMESSYGSLFSSDATFLEELEILYFSAEQARHDVDPKISCDMKSQIRTEQSDYLCSKCGTSTYKTNKDFDVENARGESVLLSRLRDIFRTCDCEILSYIDHESSEHVRKVVKELKKLHRYAFTYDQVKDQKVLASEQHSPPNNCCSRFFPYTRHIRVVLKLYLNPAFLIICLSRAVHLLTFMGVLTVIVDFSMDRGLKESDGKYAVFSMSLGDLLGRLFTGWITDCQFISLERFMLIAMFFIGVISVSLPFLPPSSLLLFICVYSILQGSVFIRHPVLVSKYTRTDERTVGMGFMTLFSGLLGFLLPVYIGHFRDYIGSYNPVFYINGGICILIGFLWTLAPLLKRFVR